MDVVATGLGKQYVVADKPPGLAATLRHFVRRKHRTIQAVDDVSFTIAPGEMVGFLGPNGAGKTTTLKMLTGLIRPSSGQVRVVGHDPFRRERAFLQQVTLVMGQKQQLLWDLPALDSLRINAAVYGLDDATFQQRLGELADMLDLHGQLRQPVRKLSLGQRMKAELLAALLHRPQVLFLDEPTLGLDVNAQAAMREFLRDYNRRYGATVLLTSHYMADITALCPRVLLIHQGRLIYDGALAGLLDRFAPYREVTVELAGPGDRELLSRYADLHALEGHRARFLVQREHLTAVVARLLADLDVRDLTVTDPAIDEVIGRVFTQGQVT